MRRTGWLIFLALMTMANLASAIWHVLDGYAFGCVLNGAFTLYGAILTADCFKKWRLTNEGSPR